MHLTTRQARFVEEYLVDLNGSQAAIRTGYSPKAAKEQASRLLTKANVQAVIQRKQAETSIRLQIRREDVICGLLGAAEMAKQQGDPRAMIKAAAEISKMMGFYKQSVAREPRPEAELDGDTVAEMEAELAVMSDAELLRLLEEEGG